MAKSKRIRRLKGLFLFTCFSYGVLSARFYLPPYVQLEQTGRAIEAMRDQRKDIRDADSANWKNRRDIRHILRQTTTYAYDPKHAAPGYTLMCAATASAVLMDADGTLIHSWKLPFSKAFPTAPHVPSPNPDHMVRFTDCTLLPGGELIATYTALSDTPYGYGTVKMDKDSNVIWTYPENTHHQLYIDKQGSIYALTHRYEEVNLPYKHFKTPSLNDYVVVLSPEGKETARYSVLDAFLDTPYADIFFQKPLPEDEKKNDYLHTNSVMPLEPAIADKFPMFKAGQILLSLRNQNAIAVLDPETRKIVWAMRGVWRQQHDAQFAPDGTIFLLDNLGYDPGMAEYRSRLMKIDPRTQGVVWAYAGSPEHDFLTRLHGAHQTLPNGNILLMETCEGHRITEITAEGKLVWSLIPRRPNDRNCDNPVSAAKRYPVSFFEKGALKD